MLKLSDSVSGIDRKRLTWHCLVVVDTYRGRVIGYEWGNTTREYEIRMC